MFVALDDLPRTVLRKRFADATPYPHLVLTGVSTEMRALEAAFPGPEWEGWLRYDDEYQAGKMICRDVLRMPAPLRQATIELCSPEFLGFLESVTGIEKLIPDPHLEGGGLHSTGPGGHLIPHTDFHVYTRLGLFRRLNVLVYLNPEWFDEWGGCLKLYDATGSPTVSVLPISGTIVIFRTDDRSVHGFPDPIIDGHQRNSLALYYYTAADSEAYGGGTTTNWRDRRAATGGRARLALYKTLMIGSRGLSFLAHRVNPRVRRIRAGHGSVD